MTLQHVSIVVFLEKDVSEIIFFLSPFFISNFNVEEDQMKGNWTPRTSITGSHSTWWSIFQVDPRRVVCLMYFYFFVLLASSPPSIPGCASVSKSVLRCLKAILHSSPPMIWRASLFQRMTRSFCALLWLSKTPWFATMQLQKDGFVHNSVLPQPKQNKTKKIKKQLKKRERNN